MHDSKLESNASGVRSMLNKLELFAYILKQGDPNRPEHNC